MKIYIFVFLCLQICLHCLALPTLSKLQAEIDELKAFQKEQSGTLHAEIDELKAFHKEQLSTLHAEIDELKALHKEQSEKAANTVGFTAFLNDDIDVAEDARIPFSRVQFNEGDGYSGTNSEFTCTVSGVYYFFVSTNTGEDSGSTIIVRNDGSIEHHLASTVNTGGSWDHSANSAVTRCNVGDKVYVTNVDENTTYYRATREESTQQSYYTTSFSGFLVALD